MKGNSTFITKISRAMVAVGLMIGSTVASASFVSALPAAQTVLDTDATVTVDLQATALVNSFGGAIDVTWDSNLLSLNLANVLIANGASGLAGPWDPTFLFESEGDNSTPGSLIGLAFGTQTFPTPDPVNGDQPIARLIFDVVGNAGTTDILLANNPLGWSPALTEPYVPGEVTVEASVSPVPVPAAVWLFGSGLLGLVGVARRRRA